MTPQESYQQLLSVQEIDPDPRQVEVVQHLQRIYDDLQQKPGWFKRRRRVKGLYLWGKVGIGKTFLMDLFYQSLPTKRKQRIHFHAFMQQIHNQLTKLQGKKNPLVIIAKQLSDDLDVLCFDEFVVSEITDAMLLGGLFQALFGHGICLIATSNIDPDQLYRNGLQRERFLPAIQMIKENVEVLHVESIEDYRMRHLKEEGVYYSPLGAKAAANMEKSFLDFSSGSEVNEDPLILFGREISVVHKASQVIWFDFKAICGIPRSQKDYLAIAEQYKTVLVSDVKVMGSDKKDLICSFVNLIDVFYDANIRLILSAEKSPLELYTEGHLEFEYSRTHSRLIEMQSKDYFSDENVPGR